MRLSKLFTKTQKTTPAGEVSANAKLLIQAGYIHKEMAGVYAYMPLGLKVVEKIKQVVREEMEAIDSQELIMTNLQRPEVWKQTDRWDDKNVDVWFKTKLQDGNELGLAWSHEEPILDLMRHHVHSYKDLPASVYQFQTKLRNELRAKSGIMRGREFVMKDMYSLHATQADMDEYYEKAIEAYKKIYERLGIGDETFVTFASGGAFTKFSHEFQTICSAGEDTLFVNKEKTIAVNEEVLDDATKEIGVDKKTLKPVVTAEVGNIFKFGTEKSEKMNVVFTDKDGKQKPVYLASYGVGVTRVMGVIVEKFADDNGLVWPKEVAPFDVHLALLGDEQRKHAEAVYEELMSKGISVLFDDRDISVGQKLGDADMLGMPVRLVIGNKTGDKVEYKERTQQKTELLALEQVLAKLK